MAAHMATHMATASARQAVSTIETLIGLDQDISAKPAARTAASLASLDRP